MAGPLPRRNPGVEFKTCETSAEIIKTTDWKIQPGSQWEDRNDDGAVNFIKQPSQRDKRQLLMENRFRILLAEYLEPADKSASGQIFHGAEDSSPLYKQESVIKAARVSGWVGDRFDSFMKNNTAGSAVLDTPDSINFIALTPKDDDFPFFAISLIQRSTEAHLHDADWECLVFIRPATLWDDCVDPMLCRDPFPHDYPDPLQPDFMVLPVVLLHCQVEQILKELNEMKRRLMVLDRDLTAKQLEELKSVKNSFFTQRKRNLLLHRRWEFACELAENLTEAFRVIERRYSSEDETVKYSLRSADMSKPA